MSGTIKRNDDHGKVRMARRRKDTGPDLWSLRCQNCGKPLVQTNSGYLACPKGCGGLIVERFDTQASSESDYSVLMFPDALENAG